MQLIIRDAAEEANAKVQSALGVFDDERGREHHSSLASVSSSVLSDVAGITLSSSEMALLCAGLKKQKHEMLSTHEVAEDRQKTILNHWFSMIKD